MQSILSSIPGNPLTSLCAMIPRVYSSFRPLKYCVPNYYHVETVHGLLSGGFRHVWYSYFTSPVTLYASVLIVGVHS
jgi:ABC-type multidrug transport system permease subunit